MFAYSFTLGKKVYDSGYVPSIILTIWRGGAIPGLCVQQYFEYKHQHPLDNVVKIRSYSGQERKQTYTHSLNCIYEMKPEGENILIVDDIFETGETMNCIIKHIRKIRRPQNIRTATVWLKPQKVKVGFLPDYHVNEANNDEWIVFPHEDITRLPSRYLW